MAFFEKKKVEAQLPPPRHIAIIMDGNGRWAKNRGLPRTAGQAAGPRIGACPGLRDTQPVRKPSGASPTTAAAWALNI